MDNTELNRFFFDKKEEIESMLNSFGDWQRKLRDEQSCELNKIKDVITKKTKWLWWIYQGWDLGVHFLDKTQYKIGIESEFEPTKDDPIGEFKIYITTWNIECWKWYKDSILKKYPNCFLDEGTINTKNRVYYHMPVIKRTDFRENDYINEIVKRLEEYFLFLKQESKKYMR